MKRYHRVDDYVICEYHGEVHESTEDIYGEGPGFMSETPHCSPENWKPLYELREVELKITVNYDREEWTDPC